MTTHRITMPYGGEHVSAECADARVLDPLEIKEAPPISDPGGALRAMLDTPCGMPRPALQGINTRGTVTIVVSDSFRRTGIHRVLPALLGALRGAGVGEENISFLVATGMHRPPTPSELREILGDQVFRSFQGRTQLHNPEAPEQLVHLGTTRRGTPVWINRRAVETDFLIVTGTVVLHYFAGFGGGPKSIVPGLAGVQTIAANHSLNLDPLEDRPDPRVRIGVLGGNPVAEDIAEAAGRVRVDLCVNTVLNRLGEICGLHAGAPQAAHRAACEQAAALYTATLDAPADLVIASAGTARNFLQSHKALFNAWQAMRPGGKILFLAPCPEGLGGSNFVEWLKLGNQESVIRHLRFHAEINGQTALSTLAKGASTVMVTEMPPDLVRITGVVSVGTFQEGLDRCLGELRAMGVARPAIRPMPSASHTVPLP
ncbi:MAG: nickel-dependent lactate racemase [Candidatus Hydrogenedentes bacterium]|nr:nickel-dependent lactate racemase [Candidatus Hydrogenedentota bacterium]